MTGQLISCEQEGLYHRSGREFITRFELGGKQCRLYFHEEHVAAAWLRFLETDRARAEMLYRTAPQCGGVDIQYLVSSWLEYGWEGMVDLLKDAITEHEISLKDLTSDPAPPPTRKEVVDAMYAGLHGALAVPRV
jgi:hypothetical protein